MNLSKRGGYRLISHLMLVSLFLVSSSFGIQKISDPKEQNNHIPPLSLIGVIVAEETSSSVAVLYNEDTGKKVMLTIGENILNLKLTHVLEDGIVLRKGEKIYWILLEQELRSKMDGNIQKNARDAENAGTETDHSNSGSMDNSLQEREFDRSEVQKRIERERPLLLKETSVVPNYVGGKINGFKVTGLPKESFASEIGIQKGDVIKEINGIKLNDLSVLVRLYSQIFEENRYEVLVERNKELIRQIYVLK